MLPADRDNRMVSLRESPQEEPLEYEDAAHRHSAPCGPHISRILSVIALAIASMSPAGSSAAPANKILTLKLLESLLSSCSRQTTELSRRRNGVSADRGIVITSTSLTPVRSCSPTYEKSASGVPTCDPLFLLRS
jgi:hypothetical protein